MHELKAGTLFEKTLFRRPVMTPSSFIRPIHPKTEIRPQLSTIQRVLQAGWVGQLKIHGHRVQIHIPSDPKGPLLAYTRQGKLHKKALPPGVVAELRRLFRPRREWNVVDGEWLKLEDKIFVFDFLKLDGKLLSSSTYPERWALLPRDYISPFISTLPMIKSLDKCLESLARPEPHIEGLVFRSTNTTGFEDTSIIRCRRKS